MEGIPSGDLLRCTVTAISVPNANKKLVGLRLDDGTGFEVEYDPEAGEADFIIPEVVFTQSMEVTWSTGQVFEQVSVK